MFHASVELFTKSSHGNDSRRVAKEYLTAIRVCRIALQQLSDSHAQFWESSLKNKQDKDMELTAKLSRIDQTSDLAKLTKWASNGLTSANNYRNGALWICGALHLMTALGPDLIQATAQYAAALFGLADGYHEFSECITS